MAKKNSDEAAALRAASPEAGALLDEVVALIESPANAGGSDQHFKEERRLDTIAIELGAMIPIEHHTELGALLDKARLSLVP